MGAGGCIQGIALCLTIKHPEGDIDPFDLLDMVPGSKGSWQENLAFIVLFRAATASSLLSLNGSTKSGPQCTAELSRYYVWISAIRAGCGSSTFITDQFCTTGRGSYRLSFRGILAPVTVQAGGVPAVTGFRLFVLRILMGFHGLFFFLLIKRLNLGDLMGAPAVITPVSRIPRQNAMGLCRPGTGNLLLVKASFISPFRFYFLLQISLEPQYSQDEAHPGRMTFFPPQ